MNKDKVGNLKERALKAVDENIKVIEGALHQIKYHRQQIEEEDVSYVTINRLDNICWHLRAMCSHIDIAEVARISALIEAFSAKEG